MRTLDPTLSVFKPFNAANLTNLYPSPIEFDENPNVFVNFIFYLGLYRVLPLA